MVTVLKTREQGLCAYMLYKAPEVKTCIGTRWSCLSRMQGHPKAVRSNSARFIWSVLMYPVPWEEIKQAFFSVFYNTEIYTSCHLCVYHRYL